MIKQLFRKAKQYRKKVYLNNSLFSAKKKYAFVGFGLHSLSNLYPILTHFGIHLKYICTKSISVVESASVKFPESEFITNLDIILNDSEIEAVFVSADPEAHARLLTSLLQAGKKIFVEKPPCSNSSELEKIINTGKDSVIVVGLQRRYWPGNKYLLKKKGTAQSYIYRFYFGPYPQGNVFNELFIHAIDYCMYLFGEFSILSSSHRKEDHGITTQMHVRHLNGILGLIELSTQFSWNDPVDSLSVQCTDELLEINYPLLIEGRLKPRRVLNIPSERLFRKPLIIKKYFSANNLVIPSLDLNTLVLQGFYDELRVFVDIVEKGGRSESANDLVGMRPLFRILDELKAGAYGTA